MLFDQRAQVVQVCLHALRVDAMNVDQSVVITIDESSVEIEYIGKPPGHAGAKVDAVTPEDNHTAVRHVFTTVVANTFDDSRGAGISNRKSFARLASGKELTTRGAV